MFLLSAFRFAFAIDVAIDIALGLAASICSVEVAAQLFAVASLSMLFLQH